jgi:hypothetical protein
MVLQAREISKTLTIGSSSYLHIFSQEEERMNAIRALDMFGYDEAAQFVYGCAYPEWKQRHQTKATDEQL